MTNKPNYIKAIDKLLDADDYGCYFIRDASTEELKAIKAACSIEITMREAEERKGE